MRRAVGVGLGAVGLAVVGLGYAGFRAFEPVFVYTSGWAPLPDAPAPSVETPGGPAGAVEVLRSGRERLGAPAISAAVWRDGDVAWAGAVGFADPAAGRPITLRSRFRVGSTSKAITAVAVGTLLDRGELALDAPIATWVPAYDGPGTLGQVMSHRAGIRDYGLCACFPVWEYYNTRALDLDAAVARVSGSPLRFPPGTGFAYTSLGYNLVGAAVETAAGEPFGAYVDRAVAAPLGLVDTGLDSIPGAERERVGFYDVDGGRYKPSWPVDNSVRWPSGGFLSTPSDLVRLGAVLLDDRLLSEPTRRALLAVPSLPDDEDARIYAHGWRSSPWTLFDGSVSTPSYHHNGTAVGSTSVFVVLPEQGLVISVLTNRTSAGVGELSSVADELVELFWEGADPAGG